MKIAEAKKVSINTSMIIETSEFSNLIYSNMDKTPHFNDENNLK